MVANREPGSYINSVLSVCTYEVAVLLPAMLHLFAGPFFFNWALP